MLDPVLFFYNYILLVKTIRLQVIFWKKGYYNENRFLKYYFLRENCYTRFNVKLLERDLKKAEIWIICLKKGNWWHGKSYGEYFSKVSEQEEFEEILDRMEEINEINIELKKERNRILNKKIKME